MPTTIFTAGDYAELSLPLLLGGLVGIALGLVPVLARPELTTTRLFFLGQLGLAVNFGFLASDAYLVHQRAAAEALGQHRQSLTRMLARPGAAGSPRPRALVVRPQLSID